MERRLLQIAIVIGSFVPVGAGLSGVLLGPGILGDAASAASDSHFRYLSGLLFGIGLAFLSCVPEIERRTLLVRVLTAIVMTGGLGRLFGLMVTGYPGLPMCLALGMELAVTPALCLWQSRIASRYDGRAYAC